MVLVKLTGGLGNQLFQYAAGRALSLRLNTDLILDTTYYLYVKNRTYKLNAFNISARTVSFFQAFFLKFLLRPTVYTERHYFSFDPRIAKETGNVYLDGWWQNPAYFAESIKTLLQDLKIKDQKKLRLGTNSVSVHVRRGDYAVLDGFGLCSPAYYQLAIKRMQKMVSKPKFYVFSDDIDWTKANLPFIPDPVFVEGQSEIEDLSMMTQCTHHIIANSTFSWWGSVLANTKKGITIAPTPWVNTNPVAAESLYLKDWIVLPRNGHYGRKKNKSKE